MCSKLTDPFSLRIESTARFAKYSLSCDKTLDERVVQAMLNKSSLNFCSSDLYHHFNGLPD
jgi:hypothetical protein